MNRQWVGGLLLSLSLALPASAADIEGQVINAAGKAVPHAKVWGTGYAGDSPNAMIPQKTVLRTTTADEKGRFVLKDLPWGLSFGEAELHLVLASAPGYSFGGAMWLKGEGLPASGALKIRLAPAATWRAVVTDPTGKPVPNCTLQVRQMLLNFSGKPLPKGDSLERTPFGAGPSAVTQVMLDDALAALIIIKSDARGRVTFDRAPRGGALTVVPVCGTYARAPAGPLRTDASRPAKIKLQPGATLAGRVVGPDGKPRAGIHVASLSSRGAFDLPPTVVSGANGEFSFANLPAGRCVLVIGLPPDYDLVARPMEPIVLRPGQRQPAVVVNLVEGGVVTGTVTDNDTGKPVAGAMVMESASPLFARTDAEGRYRLRLPAGRTQITGMHAGADGMRSASQAAEVVAGKEITADLVLGKPGRPTPPPEVALKDGDYPMKWVTSPPPGQYVPARSQMVSWSAARPKGLQGEPPLPRGARRVYASLRLGYPAKTYVVAFEQPAGKGKGFQTLWADTDGNGSLKGEKQVPASVKSARGYWNATFNQVTFRCVSDAGERALPVRFYSMRRGTKEPQMLYYQMAGYWEGEIETDKGKMRVAMMDQRGEGRFGRPQPAGSPAAEPDLCLWLDRSLRGAPSFEMDGGDSYFEGGMHLISGKLYEFKPAPDGSSLHVGEYAGPSGTVKVSATGGRGQEAQVEGVSLTGRGGSFTLESGGETQLPAGEYQVAGASVTCKTEKGSASIEVTPTKPLVVKAGEALTLAVGGPVSLRMQGVRAGKPAPAVSGTRPAPPLLLARGKTTAIKLEMADAQGGTVAPGGELRQESRIQGALLDGKGKVVARPKFEFG